MSGPNETAKAPAGRWRGMVPASRWLRSYDRTWFRPDLAAGVTLAAYLLPAALGDASLAGLSPEAGLNACLFARLPSQVNAVSRRKCHDRLRVDCQMWSGPIFFH